MKTIDERLSQFHLDYPLEAICNCPLEQILIMDIETTGFTARSSYLYLIGCVYYDQNNWYCKQWFGENYAEEIDVLNAFFGFLSNFQCLIHFNGNTFDIPYITHKSAMLKLPYTFDHIKQLDVYRKINPFRGLFKLPDCKQSTVEKAMGLHRTDRFTGGELINVYKEYVKHPEPEALHILLLHNADDIKGLLFIHDPIHVKKIHAGSYTDHLGESSYELLMEIELPFSLPLPITCMYEQMYCKIEAEHATIKVPIFVEEMKTFFANYKDYYYLPKEDIAIHRSISSGVDKDYRIPATAATCYMRKTSYFLPQWDEIFLPLFVRQYKDKRGFFELNDSVKHDRDGFDRYARHLLTLFLTKA